MSIIGFLVLILCTYSVVQTEGIDRINFLAMGTAQSHNFLVTSYLYPRREIAFGKKWE